MSISYTSEQPKGKLYRYEPPPGTEVDLDVRRENDKEWKVWYRRTRLIPEEISRIETIMSIAGGILGAGLGLVISYELLPRMSRWKRFLLSVPIGALLGVLVGKYAGGPFAADIKRRAHFREAYGYAKDLEEILNLYAKTGKPVYREALELYIERNPSLSKALEPILVNPPEEVDAGT